MPDGSLVTRLEVKSVDGAQRIIEGYCAAFGNRDRTGDIIQPGAFDRTLKESAGDVLVFIGHDASKLPVGEPLSMVPDTTGLFTKTLIYATPDGDALLEIARKRMSTGRAMGLSIGYRTVREKWVGKDRHLIDLDLLEYSYLGSPALAANPLAVSTGMKARARAKAAVGVANFDDTYEDLIDDLEDAAAEKLGVSWVQVVATFPDHVIVAAPGYAAGYENGPQWFDLPYTLDAEGEPEVGQPTAMEQAWVPAKAKARADLLESKPYRVEKDGSQYCVVGPGGKRHGCHPTRQEANAQMQALYANEPGAAKSDGVPDMTVKSEWTAAYVNSLPDSAFAFIEPGGALDDEKKTTPRANRHFPHHDADGKVDLPHLRNALARAPQSPDGDKAMPHLEKHAAAEGIGGRGEDSGKALVVGDVHDPEWQEGAAGTLLVLSLRMRDLANDIVSDRKAMERLGLDTKKGARLNATMRSKLKDLHGTLGQILDWADAIEAGDDGKRRVDFYRHKLALAALEVSV